MTHSIELELPEDLYSLLQISAESNNRDLEMEALVIITEELQKTATNKQRRAELLSLAGSHDEATADTMLDDIKQSRRNKDGDFAEWAIISPDK